MAQFEKMLRKLSRGELTAAAEELLDRVFAVESESLKGGRKRFADEAGDSPAGDDILLSKGTYAEEYPQSAVKADAPDGAETGKTAGAADHGERFAGMESFMTNEARDTEYSVEYAGKTSGEYRWGAGGVSDFFRRDSRRYDREFERY